MFPLPLTQDALPYFPSHCALCEHLCVLLLLYKIPLSLVFFLTTIVAISVWFLFLLMQRLSLILRQVLPLFLQWSGKDHICMSPPVDCPAVMKAKPTGPRVFTDLPQIMNEGS